MDATPADLKKWPTNFSARSRSRSRGANCASRGWPTWRRDWRNAAAKPSSPPTGYSDSSVAPDVSRGNTWIPHPGSGLLAGGLLVVAVGMLTGALAMFGQIFDGAFGYSVDAGVFGAAFLMAATRPSYPKVTRFIGGLGAVACATSGALD
eukprot:6237011-Prymnesium_polylepis.1